MRRAERIPPPPLPPPPKPPRPVPMRAARPPSSHTPWARISIYVKVVPIGDEEHYIFALTTRGALMCTRSWRGLSRTKFRKINVDGKGNRWIEGWHGKRIKYMHVRAVEWRKKSISQACVLVGESQQKMRDTYHRAIKAYAEDGNPTNKSRNPYSIKE